MDNVFDQFDSSPGEAPQTGQKFKPISTLPYKPGGHAVEANPFDQFDQPIEKQTRGGRIGSDIVSAIDLPLSLPGMVAEVLGDTGSRIGAASAGASRKGAAEEGQRGGQEFAEPLMNPLGKWLDHFNPKVQHTESDIDAALGQISKWVDKGGAWVEKETKGAILKEDFQLLTNALMAGSPDVVKGGKKLFGKAAEEAPAERRLAKGTAPDGTERRETGSHPLLPGEKPTISAADIPKPDPFAGKFFDELPQEEQARRKAQFKAERAAVEKGETPKTESHFQDSHEFGEAQKAEADKAVTTAEQAPFGLGTMTAATGATAGVVYAVQGSEEDRKDLGLSAMAAAVLMVPGEKSALGPLLNAAKYSSRLLDRLPKNRTEFSKELIKQELNRTDVPKAEKEIIQKIIDDSPNEKLTALELASRFKLATQDFELKLVETPSYADYGIDNIREGYDSDHQMGVGEQATSGVPVTTVYKLPDKWNIPSAGHFPEEGGNQYGHTRSFKEGGVTHVVEMQSDLLQHQQDLSPEKRATLEAAKKRIVEEEIPRVQEMIRAREAQFWKPDSDETVRKSISEGNADRQKYLTGLKLHVSEIDAQLGAAGKHTALSPVAKNWPRRLIQEELAAASRRGETKVRFASADTVGEVEGWMKARTVDAQKREVDYLQGELARARELRNGRTEETEHGLANAKALLAHLEKNPPKHTFHDPSHESIYRRYKDEITKYLTHLGAKEVTDAEGHTWLEVPTRRGPAHMFGHADPALLAKMAAVGITASAAWAMSEDENRLLHAVEAGALALVATNPRAAVQAIKDLRKPDTRIRINHLGDDWEEGIKRAAVQTYALQREVERLVPKEADRNAITHAIEAGDLAKLSSDQKRAAQIAQNFFNLMKQAGLEAEVLKDAKENYVTHLWQREKGSGPSGPNMTGSTPFAKAREIPTIAKGKEIGLVPRTEDISAIMGIYSNSVARAIMNKRLVGALKEFKTPDGTRVLVPIKDSPGGYVQIQHPSLAGQVVHPDVAPSLRHMFDTSSPGAARRILEAVSVGTKRMILSLSGFHIKSLLEANTLASSNPLLGAKVLAQSIAPRWVGENRYLNEMRTQGAGPLITKAIQGGLEFTLGKNSVAVEDVGGSFYDGLQIASEMLDKAVPQLGMPVRQFAKLNHRFDGFMWGTYHAALKLELFAEKYQTILDNNAAAAKKGTARLMSDREASHIAATYTNAISGGLNWRRAAEAVRTKWGRDLALAATTPNARGLQQLFLLALDWTVSTVQPIIQAFGKGTGIKGIIKPQTLADLNRQYMLRAAVAYVTIANGINLALSGHNIWDNKDPTTIELGDGRRIAAFKHSAEPYKWLIEPGKQILNKLSYPVKEGANQLMGTEYLAPHEDRSGSVVAGPKMGESRLAHAAQGISPIAGKQMMEGGMGAGASSALGFPVYGQTSEQKKEAAAKKRRELVKKRIDAILEKHQ